MSVKNPEKKSGNTLPRPPIVVVMGHIDHGKSTLLDYIRKTDVVGGEAGGITQHVGAYEVEHASADGRKHRLTFLDTPGHEAFCSIRERGAKAADIAILVVSAEDGVKPQTLEALRAIKSKNIPYIVAINKTDKPNADIDRTKQSLGENEIYLEGWGGDVPNVAISALNGTCVPELLDMIILISELADLKSDPSKPATGIVIESELDNRKGISATLLIKDGTLTTGCFVVAGNSFAPVRFIEDFKGEKIDSATASRPIRILGWNEIPACGNVFETVETKKLAEEITEAYESKRRSTNITPVILVKKAVKKGGDSEDLNNDSTKAPTIVSYPLIIKADVNGSLEGVKYELAKIKHDKVLIKIVSEGIGDINENDVKVAVGDPNITIVGFNVGTDKKATAMIERSPVPIKVKVFNVIYELAEYVHASLLAKVPKEYVEESTGRARILAMFSHEKDRQVVGGKVETGTINLGNDVKIMRREAEIGRGKIRELQEKKARAQEVAEGHEFGVMIEAKVEISVGDRIEAVRTVEKK